MGTSGLMGYLYGTGFSYGQIPQKRVKKFFTPFRAETTPTGGKDLYMCYIGQYCFSGVKLAVLSYLLRLCDSEPLYSCWLHQLHWEETRATFLLLPE